MIFGVLVTAIFTTAMAYPLLVWGQRHTSATNTALILGHRAGICGDHILRDGSRTSGHEGACWRWIDSGGNSRGRVERACAPRRMASVRCMNCSEISADSPLGLRKSRPPEPVQRDVSTRSEALNANPIAVRLENISRPRLRTSWRGMFGLLERRNVSGRA